MSKNTVIDMKTSQFPFGLIQDESEYQNKILIKKRIVYKNEKQHSTFQQKINILKNIYHKNIINFRYIEDDQEGIIDIYYNYVPFAFQTFFQSCDTQTIRQIHKQLIQLVIHLAKNNILTSFNPNRCGVILNADNKWQIKYYLPLNQLLVTNNIPMLERSVQIFTVQSLNYLDLLTQNNDDQINQTYQTNSFINRKYNTKRIQDKYRHSSLYKKQNKKSSHLHMMEQNRRRKMSNNGSIYKNSASGRKQSNVSYRKSQFSYDLYKKGKLSIDSTNKGNASTLFQTLRSSNPTQQNEKQNNSYNNNNNESMIEIFKPLSPPTIIQRVKISKQRSYRVLQKFIVIIQSMKIMQKVDYIVNRQSIRQ